MISHPQEFFNNVICCTMPHTGISFVFFIPTLFTLHFPLDALDAPRLYFREIFWSSMLVSVSLGCVSVYVCAYLFLFVFLCVLVRWSVGLGVCGCCESDNMSGVLHINPFRILFHLPANLKKLWTFIIFLTILPWPLSLVMTKFILNCRTTTVASHWKPLTQNL